MTLNRTVCALVMGFTALFSTANAGFCCSSEYSCTRWDCCQCTTHLCSAQPCCEDCGFFGGAEFLYWTTEQSDLDYAADKKDPSNIVGPKKIHFAEYDWDPGFRAMVGYRLGCDGWDARLRYTYYEPRAEGSAKVNSGENEVLSPILLHPVWSATNGISAKAKCGLKYDVLDFTVSRPFCVSETLIMRPYWGVRGLWLNQSYHVRYVVGPSGFENTEFPVGSIIDASYKGETTGVGLVVGLDSNIHLCGGFSLYGNVGGSILASQMRFKHLQVLNGEDVGVNVKEKQDVALASYELGAGINWELSICDCCMLFDLGYEFTHLFPTSRNRRYVNQAVTGISTGAVTQDTVMHGLRVSGSFWF